MTQSLPNGKSLSSGNVRKVLRPKDLAWQRESVSGSFAEKLRELMDFHEINQPALARRVRVETATVSRWLSTGRLPGGQDLLALARVLETDPYKLVGSSFGEPEPPEAAVRKGRPPRVEQELAGAARPLPRVDATVTPLRAVPRKAQKKPRPQAE